MYTNYQNFVHTSLINDNFSFKRNTEYNHILEHVSFEQGIEYINFIKKSIKEDFPEITLTNITEYLYLNDKYGKPLKYNFIYNDEEIICSPTSLRYVLHSLLILKYIKRVNLKKIVEVGCGYGGLFLAINHFSKIISIEIDKYYFIDLPEISNLINKYLDFHKDDITINYSTHSAYNYGKDINDTNLFFISNYCFTEIDEKERNNYINFLFQKISNGFITWQTIFNLPISNVNIICKNISDITEEYPQTATIVHKNYYVYF